MKLILSCVLFVAMTMALPIENDDPIVNESNVEYNGKFRSHFELKDGSVSTQEGELKEIHKHQYGEAIKGHYAFVGDDGQTYAVTYVADENGFRAVGDHLPTPPPTPVSVLRALEYLRTHPQKTVEQDH